MDVIIDRFEGDFAVCEKQSDGEMIDIRRDKLPKEVKEGDYLTIEGEQVTIRPEKRKEREARIQKLMDQLWED